MARTSKWGSVRMFPKKMHAIVDAASKPRLLRCALLVEREAKKMLRRGGGTSSSSAENSYYNSDVGRYVKTSEPPNPPLTQTGALRASIQSALGFEGAIAGPTERYGKYHEFGTRLHPQRPFMRPALRKARRKFPAQFRGLI